MYNKVELCGVNTGQLPVLTEAEKRQLLTLAHAGDKAARARMVEGNLRLVLSVVQRFAQRGENLDDLFQVGCIITLKKCFPAATTWTPTGWKPDLKMAPPFPLIVSP